MGTYTLLTEVNNDKVTITLRMPFDDASMLLDVVTDSVLNGFTRGKAQAFAEGLMKELDEHLQRNERSHKADKKVCCPSCHMFGLDSSDTTCRNCGNLL